MGICAGWIEEAYEIGNEDDFNMLDESIRGAIPPETKLFKQITLTFNPWNEHHWIKARFFDNPDDETLAMTTNYLCNEWLDESGWGYPIFIESKKGKDSINNGIDLYSRFSYYRSSPVCEFHYRDFKLHLGHRHENRKTIE